MIVVDGCNRGRLWQARTPTIDRLAREGTEYLDVSPAYPARTVVCFSSMLTGAAPAEHGMRSNFAPRLGVRTESVFDTLARDGRRGRLVGIAHLLDPFGEDVVRSVTSVQPTEQIDASLVGAARRVVEEEDPDLLVLQLLAADQRGHVRGVRNEDYLDQLEDTDRVVGDFLAFLAERDKLDRATVIVMADHGQGRGIGGHGHMDWGEAPVPFVVWGAGAVPGAVSREPRSVCELAATVDGAARGRRPRGRPRTTAGARSRSRRANAGRRRSALPRDRRGARRGAATRRVLARLPREACGMEVDVLVVDDGSVDATYDIALADGAEVLSHEQPRGLGAALRSGLDHARDHGYDAAVYIDGDGEYDSAELPAVLDPVARGRAAYVVGSRFLGRSDGRHRRRGMAWHRTLANRGATAALAHAHGRDGAHRRPERLPSVLAMRRSQAATIRHDYNYAQVLTLSLWGAGIDPVEVPVSYNRRAGGRSFVRYPEYLRRVAPARVAPVPGLEGGEGQ